MSLKNVIAFCSDEIKWEKKIQDNNIEFHINYSLITLHEIYQHLLTELSTENKLNIDLKSFVNAATDIHEPLSIISMLSAIQQFLITPTAFNLKTKKTIIKKHIEFINFEDWIDELTESQQLSAAQTIARRWQDMPHNYLSSQQFISEILALFSKNINTKITVINHEELKAKKMGCITAVGQGSDFGSSLIKIEYFSDKTKAKIALVGKGITFDTGGYNIKTGGHMSKMKYDMSGAAAVIAAIYALVQNKIAANVVGIIGIADNLVSKNAYLPDDILHSYSGQTVEIDNTDAEGRLVLADCLTYAVKDCKADILLSIATLTGAIIYALGNQYAGVWATNCESWNKISKAAKFAAEGVWRMPFNDFYLKIIKSSKVADIKNSASSFEAPSSQAAEFLKSFTFEQLFLHLDIAGMDNHKIHGAMAPFVRTLYYFVKHS